MSMTYREAVAYFHSLLAFGIKPGLSRIAALLERLGNPQNDLRFVHVAGTNGKGSTSTMLSEILKDAGYKTGLFTSPYVFSFCERIQINNQNISEEHLAAVTERVKAAIEVLHQQNIVPTEFEAITAAALLYFQEQNCDYVVLEVGLGGRYDSTNIIPAPEVCVITSVSLDHTQILGDTIEQIAAEKAGILKENSICVTTSAQDPQAFAVLRETAERVHCRFTVAPLANAEILSKTISETVFAYDGETYRLPLVGHHQVENAVGVIEAAKCLPCVTGENIKNGLQNTKMRGRMEYRQGTPPMLLDGGHNPECAAALAAVLRQFAPENITALIGMMADKDCEAYLRAVLPLCKIAVFTKPENPRAAAPAVLQQAVSDLPLQTFAAENPQDALRLAREHTEKDGLLLVCGSFYLLSDLFG
ncbi:MAG: bifunctional folylpolyglutamate synthase/dihydrofolate synthase [Candidatus Fimenecus sp.]